MDRGKKNFGSKKGDLRGRLKAYLMAGLALQAALPFGSTVKGQRTSNCF